MTKPKPKSEWKVRYKPERVGGTEKPCACGCGAMIQRNDAENFRWIRTRYFSRQCQINDITKCSTLRRSQSPYSMPSGSSSD